MGLGRKKKSGGRYFGGCLDAPRKKSKGDIEGPNAKGKVATRNYGKSEDNNCREGAESTGKESLLAPREMGRGKPQ